MAAGRRQGPSVLRRVRRVVWHSRPGCREQARASNATPRGTYAQACGVPQYTVRPDLVIEIRHRGRKPRESIPLEDYDACADLDVSRVKDPEAVKGKLIRCRIRHQNQPPVPAKGSPLRRMLTR